MAGAVKRTSTTRAFFASTLETDRCQQLRRKCKVFRWGVDRFTWACICEYVEPRAIWLHFYRNTSASRSNESRLIRIMTFGNYYGTELCAQTTSLSSLLVRRSDTPTTARNAIVDVNAQCSCSARNKNVLRGQSKLYHRTDCLQVIYYRPIQSFFARAKQTSAGIQSHVSSRFKLTAAPIHQVVRSHFYSIFFHFVAENFCQRQK